MNVKSFAMSVQFAEQIIRETAQDSSRVVIPEPPDMGAWEATVTVRQVLRCLEDGDIVEGPEVNEFGHLECVLTRYAVGVEIFVTVVALKEGQDWELFVRKVIKP